MMLYLGIDQHARQLTIDLGDEDGNLICHRQVRTQWDSLRQFFAGLKEQARAHGGFMAIVEVCGFNDYLLKLLEEYGCKQIFLVQPEERKKRKTDRRDARTLRDLLWLNRERLRQGHWPAKLRVVRPPSEEDAAARQVTALRKRLIKRRTQTVNKVRTILRKHNLQHDCPTKGIQTKKAFAWLQSLELPAMDRLEMNLLLEQWTLVNQHLEQVDKEVQQLHQQNNTAMIVSSIPGMGYYNSLSVACRIGNIKDFRRACSLANFWGLTPGARNSGDTKNSLSITKAGSSHVRYVLGQVVLHVLRQDPWMRQWYQKIKRRRGSNIARVAVMRRLATIIWSMVTYQMPYVRGGPKKFKEYLQKYQAWRGESEQGACLLTR